MQGTLARLSSSSLALALLLGVGACGGAHAGAAPTTRVLRTSLPDGTETVTRLRAAARAQGCVLRGSRELTTRVFATCGELDVLFAAGPWPSVLSVQCVETNEEGACSALAERIAGAAMRLASVAPTAPAAVDVGDEGDAR